MPSPRTVSSCLPATRPERQKSGFDRVNLVIRGIWWYLLSKIKVPGGLAVLLVHLYCPTVNGLKLSLFGTEGNVVSLKTTCRFPSP